MNAQSLCATTVSVPEMWENKGRPRRRVNVNRDLTRSSGTSREGLAMKATRMCPVEGCDRESYKRGMCNMHYQRAMRTGELKRLPVVPIAERFNTKLERKPDGCIEWTGYTNANGYGSIPVNRDGMLTHRFAWTLANGPIPDGMNVLHHCDNPPCCNVEHLFLGTHADNMADMMAKGRFVNHETFKTHCPQGHPYDEANTYVHPRTSHRQCRTCLRDYSRRRRAELRGAS